MADRFKKLNLKDQDDIVVVNSPESFEPELEALTGISVIRDINQVDHVQFFLSLATKQDELNEKGNAMKKNRVLLSLVGIAFCLMSPVIVEARDAQALRDGQLIWDNVCLSSISGTVVTSSLSFKIISSYILNHCTLLFDPMAACWA